MPQAVRRSPKPCYRLIGRTLSRTITGGEGGGFPHYPGYCGAGRVVAAGKAVTNLASGDRVVIAWGGHRSHLVKKAQTVLKINDASIDSLDAAFAHIASISLLGCTRISDVPIDFYKYVHRRGVSLIGAHTFSRPKQESAPGHWTEHDDYRTFLKLVAAGKLLTRPLISEMVSPEAAHEVYARLAENHHPPLGIVFDWRRIGSCIYHTSQDESS